MDISDDGESCPAGTLCSMKLILLQARLHHLDVKSIINMSQKQRGLKSNLATGKVTHFGG